MAIEGTSSRLGLSLQQPDARHRVHLSRRRVVKWLEAALQSPAEITVRVVGEEEARALNLAYRQRDHATNVLTFDYEREPIVVADLVFCAPVVEREAQQQGKPLLAHYAHLVVHGALHAQGWDHEVDEANAQAMEQREREILQTLGVSDPYADTPCQDRVRVPR